MGIIRQIKDSVIDFILGIAPWFAPIPVAYMLYVNMIGRLDFPPIIALVGALLVELIGFSAISTAITFSQWNSSHKLEKMPLRIAIFTCALYLSIVMLINAGLDIWRDQEWAKIAAKALLSLMTVDAGLIVAIRARHAVMLKAHAEEKQERRAERQERKAAEQAAKIGTATGTPNTATGGKMAEVAEGGTATGTPLAGVADNGTATGTPKMTQDQFVAVWHANQQNGRKSVAEMAKRVGVPERTLYRWVKSIEEN